MTNDQRRWQTGTWRKSSYSQPSDSYCVEVARFCAETVSVRDSKDPAGPVLCFEPGAWSRFVDFVASSAELHL